jgi:RNA polymerase sigma factor for flagellar operon FliA
MTREEVCRRFQVRILKLARRMFDHAGPEETSLSAGDLVGYGVIGLLEAFDRYERAFGVDFSTFADYRIRGAMLDALRSADNSTRRRRELARQLAQATDRIRSGSAEPEPEAIAREMGIDMNTYWQVLDHLAPVLMIPLEDTADPSIEPDVDRRMLAQEARSILKEAIEALPDREKKAILLYYGRECSLAEIAVLFGVTPSRVCQLLATARGRLRSALIQSADIPALFEEGER